MSARTYLRLGLLGLLVLAVISVVPVFAAGIPVPGTNASQTNQGITANTLKPAACAGITLTTVVNGVTGGGGNDLVTGTAAGETVRGNAGDDCVLGGGGNDFLRGDAGVDVCIGGPGTDTFNGSCETQIQ